MSISNKLVKLISLVPPSYSLANPLDTIKSFRQISLPSTSFAYSLTNGLPYKSLCKNLTLISLFNIILDK
jgi:hypothetical protein